jgi:hypothetical protein
MESIMTREELKQKFIVDANVLRDRLEPLVTKALEHCLVGENGIVHIESKHLSSKDRIKLVLAARSLAAQLSDDLSNEVSVADLATSTGLPENQIRARANDLVKERFANSSKRGVYAANAHKIEAFLDSLSNGS